MRARRNRFAALAVFGATASVGYVVWTAVQIGGVTTTVAVEDWSEAIVPLLAAASCAYAGQRATGRMRTAWRLLAGSAAGWGVGQVAWSVYEAVLGMAVPFPSLADVGFVAAIPLAIAAVLTFPSGPASATNRWRAVLDGGIVALSLVFVAWALGLDTLVEQARLGFTGRLLVVGYPAADIAVITLLGLAVRKATGGFRVTIAMLMLAFTLNLMADGSFAYLILRGSYGILGSLTDVGWFAGYLCVALAAQWPGEGAVAAADDRPVELWQLALPWIVVLAVIVTGGWIGVSREHVDPFMSAIGSALGVLFVVSQALALNDSLRWLARSRRAEDQLKAQTELLDEVISRAPVGVERVGYNLRILDANPAVCSMLGAPYVAVVGSSVQQYLTADEMQVVLDKFKPMRDGLTDRVEAQSEVRRADGSHTWVQWIVTAIRARDGTIDYFLVILEDVSAKHESEQAALANLAELERINRLKSEFMSMVSHEFRTALTGIQGYSEVMATEDVSPLEVKEFARDINADALRLNRMITEMLDLDRIESGRITMHMETVDINGLLDQAVDRARMTTSQHRFVTNFDPALPRINGDRDHLTQVATNLLSNAVKYSPNGGDVVVTTRLLGEDVEISVRDSGQGIPPEFISRIFGRYERYDGAGAKQVVGTGLGLAIAKQIVQLHQGRIWVESTLGAGSDFRFTLPVNVAGSGLQVA